MRYYPAHRFSIAFQVNTSVGRALGRPQGAWLNTFAAIVIRTLAKAP